MSSLHHFAPRVHKLLLPNVCFVVFFTLLVTFRCSTSSTDLKSVSLSLFLKSQKGETQQLEMFLFEDLSLTHEHLSFNACVMDNKKVYGAT